MGARFSLITMAPIHLFLSWHIVRTEFFGHKNFLRSTRQKKFTLSVEFFAVPIWVISAYFRLWLKPRQNQFLWTSLKQLSEHWNENCQVRKGVVAFKKKKKSCSQNTSGTFFGCCPTFQCFGDRSPQSGLMCFAHCASHGAARTFVAAAGAAHSIVEPAPVWVQLGVEQRTRLQQRRQAVVELLKRPAKKQQNWSNLTPYIPSFFSSFFLETEEHKTDQAPVLCQTRDF